MPNGSDSILHDSAVPAAQARRKVYVRPAFTRIGIDRTEQGNPNDRLDWGSYASGQFEEGPNS